MYDYPSIHYLLSFWRSPKSRSPTGVGSGRNHGKGSAPLQKRLGNVAGASSGLIQNIKQEPVDVKPNVAKLNAAMAAGGTSSTNYRRRRSSSGSSRSSSKSPPPSRRRRTSPDPKSSSGLPPLSSRYVVTHHCLSIAINDVFIKFLLLRWKAILQFCFSKWVCLLCWTMLDVVYYTAIFLKSTKYLPLQTVQFCD